MSQENKEEIIEVKASEMKSLLDRLEKLEKNSPTLIVPKRVKDRVVLLRTYEDKLVIGYDEKKKVYQLFNQMTQNFEDKFDIIVKDGNKNQIVTVDYLHFLNNAPKIKAIVLDQKAEEITEIVGQVNRVDQKDDRIFPDKYVDLEVKRFDYISKLEILEGEHKGEQLVIANKFLNM